MSHSPAPLPFRGLPTLAVTVLCLVLANPVSAQAPAPPPDAAADEGQTVRLTPVPVPDFSAYEPAVANQLRQVQAALATLLERMMGDQPTSPDELARSFGDVGRHYHAYGLTDAAIASYANAAQLSPRDPRWPHLLGRARQDAGDLDGAVAAYEAALELAPDDVPAILYLAQIRVLQGDTDAAQALYRRALALEPGSASALVGLGEAALEAGQPARAVEFLQAALEANPAATRIHHPLGLAYKALGEEDQARSHLQAAGTVGIRVDDPLIQDLESLKSGERVHLLRGHMAFRSGHFGEAADAYHRAAEANPQSLSALTNLATALSRIGYLEGAEDHLRRALAVDPENANVHYNLGVLLQTAGEIAGAEIHLRRAAALDPDDPAAAIGLADLLSGSEPDTALALYRRAQALPRAGEGAYLGEVRLLLGAGQYAAAAERAEAGFEAVPASVALLGTVARLLAASPDQESRDGERAVTFAERFYAAEQTLASGEVYALALAEAGRCEEAAGIQAQLVQVAEQNGAGDLVPALRADLERYQAGAPCRPPVAGDASPRGASTP